jgi:hypothetical protein
LKRITAIFFSFVLLSLLFFSQAESQWARFNPPRAVIGGSAGYYRVSFENFTDVYDSRWDYEYSSQVSIRIIRSNYATIQYSRFQKTRNINTPELSGEAAWEQRFINVGIRWYSDTQKRWRFYSGFGFSFVSVTENSGFSVLESESAKDVTTDGSGFYLEIGADYIFIPHVGLNIELEISSAGEGGTPGFMGSSLGGYTFLTGLSFHF